MSPMRTYGYGGPLPRRNKFDLDDRVCSASNPSRRGTVLQTVRGKVRMAWDDDRRNVAVVKPAEIKHVDPPGRTLRVSFL